MPPTPRAEHLREACVRDINRRILVLAAARDALGCVPLTSRDVDDCRLLCRAVDESPLVLGAPLRRLAALVESPPLRIHRPTG